MISNRLNSELSNRQVCVEDNDESCLQFLYESLRSELSQTSVPLTYWFISAEFLKLFNKELKELKELKERMELKEVEDVGTFPDISVVC